MIMHGTDFSTTPSGPSGRADQARLDEAIERADDLLFQSLKIEERLRRRRQRNLWLMLGGLFMFATIGGLIVALALNAAPQVDKSGQLSADGWRLWQSGQPDEAAQKFEEAVKLAPKNTNAWNGLGWARFNAGKYEDADKAFHKVISMEPKHPAALNGLGQLNLMQRNYKEAEKYLLKAAPQAPAAWYGLAPVLARRQVRRRPQVGQEDRRLRRS